MRINLRKSWYTLTQPLCVWIFKTFFKRHEKTLDEAWHSLYPSGAAAFCAKDEIIGKIHRALTILLITLGLTVLLLIRERQSPVIDQGNRIIRNPAGEGARDLDLAADVDGEVLDVQIHVSEQRLDQESVEYMKQVCEERILTRILGENDDPAYVVSDLDFTGTLPDLPVTISYTTDNYAVIGMRGQIYNEDLAEPVIVRLTADCAYLEEQWTYTYELTVFPKPEGDEAQAWVKKLSDSVSVQDSKTAEEPWLTLPDEVEGKPVSWRFNSSGQWMLLPLTGLVLIIWQFVRQRQAIRELAKRRDTELALDYPVFVHKFLLFLGAGMTARAAWTHMVSDYEEDVRQGAPRRFVYEEMIVTVRQMQQGVTETAAYDQFGARCGQAGYIRFSGILIQSIRTGARGLSAMLSEAAGEAEQMRREAAKRMGETAGTRLLFPMVILLAVVMFILVVPALMTINL